MTINSMILYDNIIQRQKDSKKGRCESRPPEADDPAICFFTTRGGRQATKFILSSRAPTLGRGEGSDLN